MITYVKILAVFYTFNPSYVKFFAIFSFPFLFEENHCCDLFFIPISLIPSHQPAKYKNFVVRNSFAKITQRRYANSTPITDFFAEYNILEFSALCLHKIYLL